MNTWFTVKVKYTKQLEDGRLKRVTEPYLVDATTFTDAEARMYEEIGQSVTGEFIISGISRVDYADVFYYEDSEDWYKCKMSYVSVDADEGKEKKITSNILVTASSVKEAFERVMESMSDMMVSFDIPAITLTNLVDVLPYEPSLEEESEEMSNERKITPAFEEEETEVESETKTETDEESEEEGHVVFEDETEL